MGPRKLKMSLQVRARSVKNERCGHQNQHYQALGICWKLEPCWLQLGHIQEKLGRIFALKSFAYCRGLLWNPQYLWKAPGFLRNAIGFSSIQQNFLENLSEGPIMWPLLIAWPQSHRLQAWPHYHRACQVSSQVALKNTVHFVGSAGISTLGTQLS